MDTTAQITLQIKRFLNRMSMCHSYLAFRCHPNRKRHSKSRRYLTVNSLQYDMQNVVFDDLVTRLGSTHDVPIIAVSGFYGAGKTEFCKAFANHLQTRMIKPVHVHTDMYFRYSRAERAEVLAAFRKQNEYESRQAEAYALNTPLMLAHLASMKQQQAVHASGMYRRETGAKDLEINLACEGNALVLYDGMWILDASLRQFYDIVLFLTAPRDVRIQRTIRRANQQTRPYTVTARLFDDIDRFTTSYLNSQLRDSDVLIDTSDYASPSIIQ